ncbi:MAG: hypothetical protein ACM3Q4_14555 [Acidobacteriota bacterium]
MLISLACLCALLSVPASSQITLQAGGGLGFVVASGDNSGSTTDFYNGSKYGFSNGWMAFAKMRGGIAAFTMLVEVDYVSFSAKGDAEPGQGSINTSQKIISFKTGPEYSLVSVPMAPIKPYLGLNFQLNSFSGEAEFNGTARVPSATYSIAKTSRVGIGAEIGTLVAIAGYNLDFNISYNFMNLWGREFTSIQATNPRRSDSYLGLNDASDPLYRTGDTVHFIGENRAIHTLMFTASFLFGL